MKYTTIICQENFLKDLLKFSFEAALVRAGSQICDSFAVFQRSTFLKLMICIYILNIFNRENSFDYFF